MPIVAEADFIEYVGSEIYANQPWLASSLAAAERVVRDHCHREFVIAAAPATARVYVPPACGDLLYVDDISTTTDLVVSNNGVTVAASSYQLEPLNGLSPSGYTVPYTAIRLTSGSWTRDGDKATASITARWGWLAFTENVIEACRVLAKDFAALRDARFGVAGFGEFGVVRMKVENPQVVTLLEDVVRHDRVGV